MTEIVSPAFAKKSAEPDAATAAYEGASGNLAARMWRGQVMFAQAFWIPLVIYAVVIIATDFLFSELIGTRLSGLITTGISVVLTILWLIVLVRNFRNAASRGSAWLGVISVVLSLLQDLLVIGAVALVGFGVISVDDVRSLRKQVNQKSEQLQTQQSMQQGAPQPVQLMPVQQAPAYAPSPAIQEVKYRIQCEDQLRQHAISQGGDPQDYVNKNRAWVVQCVAQLKGTPTP